MLTAFRICHHQGKNEFKKKDRRNNTIPKENLSKQGIIALIVNINYSGFFKYDFPRDRN